MKDAEPLTVDQAILLLRQMKNRLGARAGSAPLMMADGTYVTHILQGAFDFCDRDVNVFMTNEAGAEALQQEFGGRYGPVFVETLDDDAVSGCERCDPQYICQDCAAQLNRHLACPAYRAGHLGPDYDKPADPPYEFPA